MIELERALLAIGRDIAVPEAPDLTPAVLGRIDRPRVSYPRRRWVLAVAVAVIATLAATLAIPEARSALFRVLRIGGERIELVDQLPAVTPAPTELDLEFVLGMQVTLEEARRTSEFDLRELDETPDRAYRGARGTVWFLYGTPERVRLLVAQTPRHSFAQDFILKKLAGAGTQVEHVSVGGSPGLFLGGEPHVVLLLDSEGQVVEESARLAQHVLVWESGGVAYRLEGDFDRETALRLARALR